MGGRGCGGERAGGGVGVVQLGTTEEETLLMECRGRLRGEGGVAGMYFGSQGGVLGWFVVFCTLKFRRELDS